MLILSRRETEKVLFPTLGITVEVTRVKGNTVRLGIDAPQEIRVIRGELESVPPNPLSKRAVSYESKLQSSPSEDFGSRNEFDSGRTINSDVQKCLDAANLAIHLAQNQLNQKLTCHAEKALQQALACLEDLEFAVADSQSWNLETAAVHEPNTGYRVTTANPSPVAAVFARDDYLRERLSELLESIDFKVVKFEDEFSLLDYLRNHQQPAIVLTVESAPSKDEIGEPNQQDQLLGQNRVLEICGVSGLKKNSTSFSLPPIGERSVTTDSILTCFQSDRFDSFAPQFDTQMLFDRLANPGSVRPMNGL